MVMSDIIIIYYKSMPITIMQKKDLVQKAQQPPWASGGGSKGEQMLPLDLVKHLVKILTFCFIILLTFGQNTNICSP